MLSIAHLADVHIRGIQRHDETRHVFKSFINDCKARQIDHIFIAGDIFHTKTSGITPEYIDLMTELFKELSSCVKGVHVTLGNHDGNLTNLSRQDAVSPIINVLSLGNVFLYKKSGVYKIDDGVALSVFSVFDEDNWDAVKRQRVENCINIATYHGPVRGAKTETGWDVSGEVDTSFFKDYHFVWLGDIHKQQYLQPYREDSTGTPKPHIGYPGSFIQQNFGEEIHHGYLHWQIIDELNWNVDFIKLASPTPWITAEWRGDVASIIEQVEEYLPGAHIRIKSLIRLPSEDTQYALTTLLNRGASDVIFVSDDITSPIEEIFLGDSGSAITKADLRDIDSLFSLVYSTYNEKYSLSEDEWGQIYEKIKGYIQSISNVEEVSRGITWSISNLDWSGTFSYGKDNSLSFSNLSGTVGIFGNNKVGKSSIVGTILYSLYSAIDRGNLKNLHIINTRLNECSTDVNVHVGSDVYQISRKIWKNESKKGVISTSASLDLQMIDVNGTIHNLKGEQKYDTEKPIKRIIGSVDDFMLTAVATQGDVDNFIKLGSTQRKRIICKFLDIDIFDKIHQVCNEFMKIEKGAMKKLLEVNYELEIDGYLSAVSNCESEIEKLTKLIEEQTSQLENLQSLQTESEKPEYSDYKALKEKLFVVSAKFEKAKIDLNAARVEKDKLITGLSKLKEKVDSISVSDLQSNIAALENAKRLHVSLSDRLKDLNRTAEQKRKNIKLLQSVPCGDSFPTCRFISDAASDHTDITSLTEEINKVTGQISSTLEVIKELEKVNAEAELAKYRKFTDVIASTNENINYVTKNCMMLEEFYSKLETETETLRFQLEKHDSLLTETANSEAVKLQKKIDHIKSEMSMNKTRVSGELRKIGGYEQRLEMLRSQQLEKNEKLKILKQYELLTIAFSKKGLSNIIINQQLPQINAEIAKILTGVVDFTCELEIKDDDLEIFIQDSCGRRIIELCSGMEKVICSLAIRVALSNISTLPKPNFFIIDEGFGALDEEGVVNCGKFLNSLKHYYKTIFVITHVEAIKDMVDSSILITRGNEGFSVISHEKNT